MALPKDPKDLEYYLFDSTLLSQKSKDWIDNMYLSNFGANIPAASAAPYTQPPTPNTMHKKDQDGLAILDITTRNNFSNGEEFVMLAFDSAKLKKKPSGISTTTLNSKLILAFNGNNDYPILLAEDAESDDDIHTFRLDGSSSERLHFKLSDPTGWNCNYYIQHGCFDHIYFVRKSDYLALIEKKKKEGIKVDTKVLERVVLNEKSKREIVFAVKQLEYQHKIFVEWGLEDIIEYGRGVTMLFWGIPGTGKTQTAKLIAKAINKDLMIISMAELQSSIPGEYERNVKAAFAQAKRKNNVMLIDEADSMVMSREGMGQIMSSENNCLMTEIEKYEGIIILTTNRIAELDKALERRISAIIHFELPSFDQRKDIWSLHLPKKMPLHKDVSIPNLAEHALTGGQIKNVVLNAARYAACSNSAKVTHQNFLDGIERVMSGKKAFAKESTMSRIVKGADAAASSRDKHRVEGSITKQDLM